MKSLEGKEEEDFYSSHSVEINIIKAELLFFFSSYWKTEQFLQRTLCTLEIKKMLRGPDKLCTQIRLIRLNWCLVKSRINVISIFTGIFINLFNRYFCRKVFLTFEKTHTKKPLSCNTCISHQANISLTKQMYCFVLFWTTCVYDAFLCF